MLIRKAPDVRSSEITPKEALLNRRTFLTGAAVLGAGAIAASQLPGIIDPKATASADSKLKTVASKYTLPDTQTPFHKATQYNNFYEFGTDKSDPSHNAHTLRTRPWTVQVTGMVKKPLTVNIDDLMNYRPLESRVYRHRCVEAWSMVIPWDGYSLSELI